MADPIVEMLAQVFPRLSPAALDALQRAARRVKHPAQVTLCREGEIEHSFYIIVAGRVDVYKLLEGQRLLINQLASGAHFGDIALLLDVPRTATIITAEPTEVLEIDRGVFILFLESNPEIVVALSQMVLRRFLAQEEKQLMEIARLKKRDVPPAKVFMCYSRAAGGLRHPSRQQPAQAAHRHLARRVPARTGPELGAPGRRGPRQLPDDAAGALAHERGVRKRR
jgi:CRP-like cAMP-binding protein